MRRLFIVRKDLNLSSGKLAAQVSHCAELYWLHILSNSLNYQILTDTYESWGLDLDKDIVEEYIRGSITKTVLQAKNLNQLLKAKILAEDLGLNEGIDFGFVNDLCLTELTPDPGKNTCTTCFLPFAFSNIDSHICNLEISLETVVLQIIYNIHALSSQSI